MKARPCKKQCGYQALPRLQFCYWHNLLRLSSYDQQAAAEKRLDAHEGDLIPRRKDAPEGERWCAGCQSFVPLFYCSGSRCKACVSKASHERRLADNYGIDPAEYERIFRLQGYCCGICGSKPRSIRFAVDHDHKTGEVRGILCKRCNHDLLGGGHDDPLMLFRGVEYLLFPPSSRSGLPTLEETMFAIRRLRVERLATTVPALPPPF